MSPDFRIEEVKERSFISQEGRNKCRNRAFDPRIAVFPVRAALHPCKLANGRFFLSTALLQFTAAAATDRGRKRPSNEDAFGFSVEDGVYLVCDGMGGAAAGEIASSIAVDELLRLLTANATGEDAPGPMPARAEQAICAANEAIYSRSQRNYKLSGMGTTLVGLLVEERRIWVLNVGDSRCYRLRGRSLEQITNDHSLVEEQVRLGRMSRFDAQRSPLRNVITRALGTQCRVTPDIFELAPEPGDLFLLCSDGLTRELSDPMIESILEAGEIDQPLDALCSRLVDAAKKAGGHDNITCILVRASE
jgi:protein phosphatase